MSSIDSVSSIDRCSTVVPLPRYVFKLQWVLMEFLFHGRNHVLLNEHLCVFYRQVLDGCEEKIAALEGREPVLLKTSKESSSASSSSKESDKKSSGGSSSGDKSGSAKSEGRAGKDAGETGSASGKNAAAEGDGGAGDSCVAGDGDQGSGREGSGNAASGGEAGGGGSSGSAAEENPAAPREDPRTAKDGLVSAEKASSSVPAEERDFYHPYRIRATAQYTLVNLCEVVDYATHSGCSGGRRGVRDAFDVQYVVQGVGVVDAFGVFRGRSRSLAGGVLLLSRETILQTTTNPLSEFVVVWCCAARHHDLHETDRGRSPSPRSSSPFSSI